MTQLTNSFKILPFAASSLLIGSLIILAGCKTETGSDGDSQMKAEPHIMASSQIEAGRYLITIGGCNDCHTDGYQKSEGKVPEENWLTGSAMGWRGPWGTTYNSNLRLLVQEITEEDWVLILHERTELPPMPWMNTNKLSEADAKAMYQYIKSLGPKGENTPEAIGPEEEPQTPYLNLMPQNLPQK